MAFYGAGSSLWPFPPRCVSSVCVEGSRMSTPEKATRAWPIKGVEDLSENCASLFGPTCLLSTMEAILVRKTKLSHTHPAIPAIETGRLNRGRQSIL